MGQNCVTGGPSIQGENLFSTRVSTASIYLSCTSGVCSRSTNVLQDQPYNTQGSFEHLISFLSQFIRVIWMTDFWCSTTVDCQKLFLFTLEHPAFLFPQSDEQLMTQCWWSRDCLPVFLLTAQNRNPCRCTELVRKNCKAECCCFTASFQKKAHDSLVNHHQFICHSCHMPLASSFIRNAMFICAGRNHSLAHLVYLICTAGDALAGGTGETNCTESFFSIS